MGLGGELFVCGLIWLLRGGFGAGCFEVCLRVGLVMVYCIVGS